jgi:hypothetical protein
MPSYTQLTKLWRLGPIIHHYLRNSSRIIYSTLDFCGLPYQIVQQSEPHVAVRARKWVAKGQGEDTISSSKAKKNDIDPLLLYAGRYDGQTWQF